MKRQTVKLRQGHFERFSMPKDFVTLKMGVEKDELDRLINTPIKENKHQGKRKRLDNMIKAQNRTGFLNDLYGF